MQIKKQKVLEICVDLDGGGIDRYLLNYCSRIPSIHFDFVIIDKEKEGILEKPIREMGCNIFKVPRQSDGVVKYYNALKSIMKSKNYDAVHIHLGNKSHIALLCAINCGIKCRIVHAHIAFVPESRLMGMFRTGYTLPVKMMASNLSACGVDAGNWVWGKRTYASGRVSVHNNAISTEHYRFVEEVRNQKRDALGIDSTTLVVGHVGRLSDQKNQLRLVRIFSEIKHENSDSVLILIGRGELDEEIRKLVNDLNLDDSVKMLGVRDDVNELLSAMDVFVFPSKYEGLPFTLIEVQCNGLPIVSSDLVTKHVKVADNLCFLSLNESDEKWASVALECASNGHNPDGNKIISNAGYDIDIEARKLEQYYRKCIEECNEAE